jgi:hypothetical protein
MTADEQYFLHIRVNYAFLALKKQPLLRVSASLPLSSYSYEEGLQNPTQSYATALHTHILLPVRFSFHIDFNNQLQSGIYQPCIQKGTDHSDYNQMPFPQESGK